MSKTCGRTSAPSQGTNDECQVQGTDRRKPHLLNSPAGRAFNKPRPVATQFPHPKRLVLLSPWLPGAKRQEELGNRFSFVYSFYAIARSFSFVPARPVRAESERHAHPSLPVLETLHQLLNPSRDIDYDNTQTQTTSQRVPWRLHRLELRPATAGTSAPARPRSSTASSSRPAAPRTTSPTSP